MTAFVNECRKYLARGSVLVLLAVAVAITALNQWGAHSRLESRRAQYAEIRVAIERAIESGDVTREEVEGDLELVAEEEAAMDDQARMFAFPRSMQIGLQSLATAGSLPIALAAGLVFGSEFAWGTHRTAIALGRKRRTVIIMQYTAFSTAALGTIPATALLATLIDLLRADGISQPGGWSGLAAAAAGAIVAILLWSAVGLLSAVLTKSVGAAVIVVAMVWVAIYFISFLGPTWREWSLANLVVQMVVFDASKFLTSPFLAIAGVDAVGVSLGRAALTLTAAGLLAAVGAVARFVRAEIR